MYLTRYALQNPHFTITLLTLLLLFGVTGYLVMPRAEDPFLEQPIAFLTVAYPGASPEDIETLVVDPLEASLKEVDELDHIDSRIEDGVAEIVVEWSSGDDRSEVRRKVENALTGARAGFPTGVSEVSSFFFSTYEQVRILQLALVSASASPRELRETAELIEDDLNRLPGVRSVEIEGVQPQVVRVSIDPAQLAHYQLPLSQVVDSIASHSTNIPAGSVYLGPRKFNVQATSEYEELEELRATAVAARDSSVVHIGDVARVELVEADPVYRTRLDGVPCVFIALRQKEGTNLLDVRETIEERIRDLEHQLPEGMELQVVFDQARSVADRLNHFQLNLGQGIVLVGFVIVLGLGWSASLIVMIAIPASFLIALGFVNSMGFALQQSTITALVISLGLLVDNAIVVTESISREVHAPDRLAATLEAMSRVASAITSATLTTALAFLPIALMQDVAGDYIRSMPVTVILALLASLLIALTLTPLMGYRLITAGDRRPPLKRGLDWVCERVYRGALQRCLQRPKAVVGVAACLLVGSLFLLPVVGVSYFPKAEKSQLLVDVHLPRGSSLEATDAKIRLLEEYLLAHAGVERVAANIGKGNPPIFYNMDRERARPYFGQLLLLLSGDSPGEEFLAEIRRALGSVPGARIQVKEFQQGRTIEAPIVVRVRGDDLELIEQLADEVEQIVASVGGVISVRNLTATRAIDLKVRVNKEEAALRGVDLDEIGRTIRAAVAGIPSGRYRDRDGDYYDILVRFPPEKGYSAASNASGDGAWQPGYESLADVYVSSREGVQVPLLQLASVTFQSGHGSVMHRDLKRMVVVTADVAGRTVDEATAEIRRQLRELPVPGAVSIEIGGEVEKRGESFTSLYRATVIALVAIFGVLVLQFRSYAKPLIVLSSVPLAVIGVLLGLWVSGNSFSFMAFVGVTSLVGIVVNNSILLIDRINQMRDGSDLRRVIVEACATRLNPVTLTTLTTILGLLPLTLSGSAMWSPMGWAIVGGLLVSTLTTLVATPVLYLLFERGELARRT